MGKKSRDKGKRGELDARDAVREHWYAPSCVRAAQRAGHHSADLLDALPRAHVEVKRHKRIVAADFLRQAEKDARKEETPVVLFREDDDPGWCVLLRLDHSLEFARSVLGAYLETFAE